MKIIAFGASNSKKSINQQLAKYATLQFKSDETELLDLNDYQCPVFSIDDENEHGFPAKAKEFVSKLDEADLLIISLAEHNGSYTAAFKNLFDWGSRVKLKLFEKKMLLLSATPGQGGGKCVLETAKTRFPKHGAEVLATFSLPKFGENFNVEKGIINAELKSEFDSIITSVKEKICPTSN